MDTSAAFAVTLSAASTTPITVNYATQDGTAHAGKDYAPITNGSLTFNPGETSKMISVGILSDGIIDGKETFSVTLVSNPSINITHGQAFETINPSQGDILGQNLSDLAALVGQVRNKGVIGDVVVLTNDVYKLAHLDPATTNAQAAHTLFETFDHLGGLLGHLEPGIASAVTEAAVFHDAAAQFALGDFTTGFDTLAKFSIISAGAVIGYNLGGITGADAGAAVGATVANASHTVGVWLAHNWFDAVANTIGQNLPHHQDLLML